MRIQHLSRGDQAQYQDESDEADIRSMNALVGSTAHPRSPGHGHNIRTSWISGDNCRIWGKESESGYRGLVARRFGGRTFLLDTRIHTYALTLILTHLRGKLEAKRSLLTAPSAFRSKAPKPSPPPTATYHCVVSGVIANKMKYSLIGVPPLGERNEQPSPSPPSSPHSAISPPVF